MKYKDTESRSSRGVGGVGGENGQAGRGRVGNWSSRPIYKQLFQVYLQQTFFKSPVSRLTQRKLGQ